MNEVKKMITIEFVLQLPLHKPTQSLLPHAQVETRTRGDSERNN